MECQAKRDAYCPNRRDQFRWIEWRGHVSRLKSLKPMGYIIGNGSGIHLVLSTDREYTFNCDDPMACLTVFDEITTADDLETLETVVVDGQPVSSKL